MSRPSIADCAGQRFGIIVAIKRLRGVGLLATWLVRCDCGREAELLRRQFDGTKTTGCLQCAPKFHGSTTQRFERYVTRGTLDECWEWTGYRNRGGYGVFGTVAKKTVLAHRFSWEMKNGLIPEGMCALHRCDNPPCVNPDHLFIGTRTDNNHDKGRKKRGRGPRGVDNHKAKLTEADVLQIRAIRKTGLSLPKIARQFGVSHTLINMIVKRRIWKHVA